MTDYIGPGATYDYLRVNRQRHTEVSRIIAIKALDEKVWEKSPSCFWKTAEMETTFTDGTWNQFSRST